MKRFFAFGCSFTNYCWPSWADFLGVEFDYYENWGIPGVGNRAILERLLECHSKNKFNSNDLVVVQWSTHLRNDYHRFRITRNDLLRLQLSWKTNGSILNYMNAEKYDDKWLYEFFDEKSYVMHNLNYMVAAKNLLENSQAQWAMTSLADFQYLGNDILDPGNYKESTNTVNNLWKDYPEFLHYKETIWGDNSNWCEPIGTIVHEEKENLYKWPEKDMSVWWTDPHPTSRMHLSWLNKYLKPKLNLPMTDNEIHNLWLTRIDELKPHGHTMGDLAFLLKKNLPKWNFEFKGY